MFDLQEIRSFKTGFYSGLKADTLLGFGPSRVCPCPEMEKISLFLLPYACSLKTTEAILKDLNYGASLTGQVVSSRKTASSFRVSDLICLLKVNRHDQSGLILLALGN